MSDNLKGILLASTTAVLWGFLPLFLKYALQFSDSLTIVWFRFLAAFLILCGIFAIKNPKLFYVLKRPSKGLFLGALALGLNYWGYMKGVEITGPENSQILIQTSPLLFALVGIYYFKERLSLRQMMGFGISSLGFILFYRDLLAQMIQGADLFQLGSLWIGFAALTWVVYATLNKILLKKWQSQQINLLIYGFCALLFLPAANFDQVNAWSSWHWLVMLLLGVNTLLAYGAFAEAVRWISAPKVSIIITLNPIITLILMKLIENNSWDWITSRDISSIGYSGAALVLLGAILVASRPKVG